MRAARAQVVKGRARLEVAEGLRERAEGEHALFQRRVDEEMLLGGAGLGRGAVSVGRVRSGEQAEQEHAVGERVGGGGDEAGRRGVGGERRRAEGGGEVVGEEPSEGEGRPHLN